MCRIDLSIPAPYESFTYLLPYVFNSLRIGPFLFQAGGRKRPPNITLVFCVYFALWYICRGYTFAFVVFALVFLY